MKKLQPILRYVYAIFRNIHHEKRFCATLRESEYFEIEGRKKYTLLGEEGRLLTGKFRNMKNDLTLPGKVFLISLPAKCEIKDQSYITVKDGDIKAYTPTFRHLN